MLFFQLAETVVSPHRGWTVLNKQIPYQNKRTSKYEKSYHKIMMIKKIYSSDHLENMFPVVSLYQKFSHYNLEWTATVSSYYTCERSLALE